MTQSTASSWIGNMMVLKHNLDDEADIQNMKQENLELINITLQVLFRSHTLFFTCLD
ncbi:hypothetical protein SERLA73DRAFT_76142 [Serpula lacrymans var. lacrymans S7.3]|uniref:Uncharacterized protein n=1 Tax=Serpula lacrymans var. lacrymans (strain S7.3) TaxID=936435 RepID=F8Q6B2_SERL3|nr:hypothetical protein SERLA73DRAFT_76142 [Serpula lacrymans var. lacrymans S7.3]